MTRALTLRAGPDALRIIRERGLRFEDVDVFPAASGGAKWLALAGLDRYLFGRFMRPPEAAPRTRPLYAIGSSIGSWRIACLTQSDPVAALARGHEAYIYGQRYSPKPTTPEITTKLAACLDALLGAQGARELVSHPYVRPHVITASSTGLASRSSRLALAISMLMAATGNALHRRTLASQFRRTIFHTDASDSPLMALRDFPTDYRTLTATNARDVLLASGAIPLLVDGVRFADEPRTVHYDGGVVDYHPDLAFGASDGLVLYPHFYSHIVPGWFDKSLPWRWARATNFRRALIIAPSAAFVATLPGGNIPHRRDFQALTHRERERNWARVFDLSARLEEEFHEMVEKGDTASRITEWV